MRQHRNISLHNKKTAHGRLCALEQERKESCEEGRLGGSAKPVLVIVSRSQSRHAGNPCAEPFFIYDPYGKEASC